MSSKKVANETRKTFCILQRKIVKNPSSNGENSFLYTWVKTDLFSKKNRNSSFFKSSLRLCILGSRARNALPTNHPINWFVLRTLYSSKVFKFVISYFLLFYSHFDTWWMGQWFLTRQTRMILQKSPGVFSNDWHFDGFSAPSQATGRLLSFEEIEKARRQQCKSVKGIPLDPLSLSQTNHTLNTLECPYLVPKTKPWLENFSHRLSDNWFWKSPHRDIEHLSADELEMPMEQQQPASRPVGRATRWIKWKLFKQKVSETYFWNFSFFGPCVSNLFEHHEEKFRKRSRLSSNKLWITGRCNRRRNCCE